jgi:hypothetical protein
VLAQGDAICTGEWWGLVSTFRFGFGFGDSLTFANPACIPSILLAAISPSSFVACPNANCMWAHLSTMTASLLPIKQSTQLITTESARNGGISTETGKMLAIRTIIGTLLNSLMDYCSARNNQNINRLTYRSRRYNAILQDSKQFGGGV